MSSESTCSGEATEGLLSALSMKEKPKARDKAKLDLRNLSII